MPVYSMHRSAGVETHMARKDVLLTLIVMLLVLVTTRSRVVVGILITLSFIIYFIVFLSIYF